MSEILHATQEWTNEQLELIENYGTTDVYVLQEGVDYTISNDVSSAHFRFSNGTIGTLINFNYANKTIVFPEGIIVIGESRLSNLTAKGIIMPSSLVEIKEDAFANTTSLQSVKFNDNNVTDILIGSQAFFNCRYLHKIKLSNKIQFNFDGAIFPSDTIIEGYAGSDAEKYCEKYGNDFVNMGSDYSKQIEYKVDKVDGKGLSTNDYTDEDKERLENTVGEKSKGEKSAIFGSSSNKLE